MSSPRPMKRISLLLAIAAALLSAAALLVAGVPGLNAQATQPGEAPYIRLQYASFDPLSEEPDLPAAQQLEALSGQPAMSLVQFSGPVLPEWKAAVEATGARLYDYIPDYAFLTRLDAATAESLRSLPFVRWVGAYHPAYRVPASLAAQSASAEAGQGLLELNVQALPDTDLDWLASQVTALGGSVQEKSEGDLASLLRVALPAGQVQSLAALDSVVWVEPYIPMTILNDVGSQVMGVPALRTKLNLFGSGQVVAVADTGLDVGVTTAEMSDDFEGRI
ncbi:MAG: hypothetical protein ACWGO1_05915, partial [Anaerolineales bacterium]